ncbi:MAG: hypothetical protein H7240_02570 [Glaciimonas sp.]|nr:hypothetical protein [Glaciimonas sp.]
MLYYFLNGGVAPTNNISDVGNINLISVDLREIASSHLHGTGVEFGVGVSPFSVTIKCSSALLTRFRTNH